MIKSLRAAALAWVAAAVTAVAGTIAVNYTQTNVLQNVNFQLTIYQQGPTNGNGRKVADQVTSYTTKDLIAGLAAATGQQFGSGAKLVLSTVYSNVTLTTGSGVFTNVLSNNLAFASGGSLTIGLLPLQYSGSVVIDANLFNGNTIITSDVIIATNGTNVQSVTINTNEGYVTTITPSPEFDPTNFLIETQFEETPPATESILTNVSSSIDIFYGGAADALFPVTNYLTFSVDSPEIVVETGVGLDTTNALTVTNLASQTGFSLQSLNINYATPSGTNSLDLLLQAFVKQTLKVDTLYAHGTNRVIEDIFGGTSAWNVIGTGFVGATNGLPNVGTFPFGYTLPSNALPVVVEGSINVSFLKNLPQ